MTTPLFIQLTRSRIISGSLVLPPSRCLSTLPHMNVTSTDRSSSMRIIGVLTANNRRQFSILPMTSLHEKRKGISGGTSLAVVGISRRFFQSEAEYHSVADETLESIQDAMDEVCEENGIEAEITYASGVLTIILPSPHGTYVLNKQTPNQQIWWSSPISGPRRYEYINDQQWVLTRDNSITLRDSLKEEFENLFDVELELDI